MSDGRSPVVFPLIRALTYAAIFLTLVLFLLPGQILDWAGVSRPPDTGAMQVVGAFLGVAGLVLALWCVVSFAVIGRGTPAPFDPPRRLVIRGPYRLVRNPMYIGAGTALAGAALYFRTWWLTAFVLGFLVVTHVFVVVYEEPTLRRLFGDEYIAYCASVRRWWPTVPSRPPDRP